MMMIYNLLLLKKSNVVIDNNNFILISNLINWNPFFHCYSYTYAFEEEGTYHFSSPTHPWIKGTVFVSDDISTVTQTDSENNIDVQLSWIPSSPKVGQQTHFKIIL